MPSLEEWKNYNQSFSETKLDTSETKKNDFISYKSDKKDGNDDARFRHARDRHTGFKVGYYIQTPPMIFTRDGHNVPLGDMYRGSPAFLTLGGPSMGRLDLSLIKRPGILTMGVNNSVKTLRPNLWLSVDKPDSFIMSTWIDPTITKFVPLCHAEKKLFDSDAWVMTDICVGDCPNVFYYRRNEHFRASQFLLEDTFNWGNHSDLCSCGFSRFKNKKIKVCPKCGGSDFGSRSVMLPAIRMLYFLGVRTIFLLGCDFNMSLETKNYHFEQDRSSSSVAGNNSSYRILSQRFAELKPEFERMGLCIFNCNPDSKLEVFPKVSYSDAIKVVTNGFPDIKNERTKGLYDRKN